MYICTILNFFLRLFCDFSRLTWQVVENIPGGTYSVDPSLLTTTLDL